MTRRKLLVIPAACAAALFASVAAYFLSVISDLGAIPPDGLEATHAFVRNRPALLAIRAQPEFVFEDPWNPDRISWIEQLRSDTGADEITISDEDEGAKVVIRSREPWQDETGPRGSTSTFEVFVDRRRGVWHYDILTTYD